MTTPHEQEFGRGPRSSGRTRWIIGAVVAAAIGVGIVLLVVYSGGGGGGGY